MSGYDYRVSKLLHFLSDEKWHKEEIPKGVGAVAVELCIEQGLVKTKIYDRKYEKGIESYLIAIHITTKGRCLVR